MWYTELAMKSMNVNPYDQDISEDILSKFASLKSMLSSQRLTMSLASIMDRKILFSKSVGLLALKHMSNKHRSEQGLNNPRFLLHNLVQNFFQRSYITKRSKILKDLFELALRSDNEKQHNKSRLFALKYFSSSLNKSFLDFYKKLKDNKAERLAQMKILLTSFRIANKNKLLDVFKKLSDHALGSQHRLASRPMGRMMTAREQASETKKNLIFFYQIVYAQKSKLFQCFQTLKNPTFEKKQITGGLEIVIGTVEAQNQAFKQQFLNSLFKISRKIHFRYAQLARTLQKLAQRKMATTWFRLHRIQNIEDKRLVAANRIGKISLEPSEQNVSSLLLPCLAKLVFLLKNSDQESINNNLIKNFDRYLAVRSEYDENRNSLIARRANLKFANRIFLEENQSLEARSKFLELSAKDLADKNRKINLEKSNFASVSTKAFDSINSFSENLDVLQKQLQDQRELMVHIKSERKNLKHELSATTEEVNRHLASGPLINIEDLETNVPNKSISQVNFHQNNTPPMTSMDRADRDNFEIRPKYSMEMSADESMIRKYTIEQPFSRNVRPANFAKSIDDASSRNFILKSAIEERTQAEATLIKFVEESDMIRSSMEEAEKGIELAKEKLQQLEERLVHQEMRLIDLQDRRGMVVLEKNACKRHNEKDKKRLEEIKKEIQSLESNPQNSEENRLKLEELRSDQAASFEKLRENATKVANFEVKMSELAEIQKELSKEISESKSEKSKMESESKDLAEKKKALETVFEAKTEQIKDLKKRIGNPQVDNYDYESKRQMGQNVTKRITVASENCGPETAIQDLRAQLSLLEKDLMKYQEEKGALIIQKNSKQKQSKLLMSKLAQASTKIMALESQAELDQLQETELAELRVIKDDLLGKLGDVTSSIQSCDQKTAESNAKINQVTAKIQNLKNEIEQFEKNGPNETFLSKENLIVTFKNPRNFSQEHIARNTFANSEFVINPQGNGFNFKNNQGFFSSHDLKRHIGEKIVELQKELRENTARLEKQRQIVIEGEQMLYLKSREFDQMKLKNELSAERLNGWNNAIKANCCLIVDQRDEQINVGKAISENKRRMFANRQLITEVNRKLKSLELKKDEPVRFIRTIDSEMQTESMDYLSQIRLLTDNSDNLHRKQKTILLSSDLDVLQSWLPKKFELVLSQPANYFVIRATAGMQNNSMLAEIENNYSFDENGFKFIKRDPFESKNDVEISGDYEDYFPDQSNNDFNNAFMPDSTNPQTNLYDSYKFNQTMVEINFHPKKEAPLKLLNRRPAKDFPMSDVKIYEKIVDLNGRFESKTSRLLKSINGPVKRAMSETLQDLKLRTSKTQLKRFFTTLYNWKLATLDASKDKLLNQAKRFKHSLFLLLHFAAKKQEFRAFKQIAFESGLSRQQAFFKLLPVAVRANVAHRKNLKDILTYWYHIKDENKWYGKVMKSMIFKSSLHPQIALWRLKLFRRKTSPISPQMTKGLLYLMDWYNDKQVDNIGRAFFKLSAEFRAHDYSSKIQSHISEYSNEQMSDYDSFDAEDFKDHMPHSQIQDYDNEQKERQIRFMKVNRLFELMSLKRKRLHLKYFNLLQRRALAPPAAAKQQGLGYQRERQKNLEAGEQYLQNMQFIIEQNLKCKQEIHHKDRQIVSLRSQLDQKQSDLLLLRNNFMFVFIEKIEKICSRHNRSEIGRSLKLFFRKLK